MKPEVRKKDKIARSELRLLTIDRETFSELKLDALIGIESSLRHDDQERRISKRNCCVCRHGEPPSST